MVIQYVENEIAPGVRINARLYRVGVFGKIFYLYFETDHYFEYYAIDIRFPLRWKQVAKLEKHHLNYTFATLSLDGKYINVLVLQVADGVEFCCYRLDVTNGEKKLYKLAVTPNSPTVFDVPLDHVTVRAGNDGQVIMYDRTIIEGDIPYWLVRFNDADSTFSLAKNSIGTAGIDEGVKSQLFTIAYDPTVRCFAKLMGPRKMLVYTEERKRWVEYFLPEDLDLSSLFGFPGFPIEENRGIRETYGNHGRRVGAMETRLTFHDLDGELVARVLQGGNIHTTALVELVHNKREIRVTRLAKFKLKEEVSRMFYFISSRDYHAFLGVYESAFVITTVPSLEQLSSFPVQLGLLANGHAKEVIQVSNYEQLRALAYAKSPDAGEEQEEYLRALGIKKPPVTLAERIMQQLSLD